MTCDKKLKGWVFSEEMRKIPTCDWMQEILILEGIDEGVNCLMSEKKNDWKKNALSAKNKYFREFERETHFSALLWTHVKY